jgi:hypothetical protein
MLSMLTGGTGVASCSSRAAPSGRPSGLVATSMHLADAGAGESIQCSRDSNNALRPVVDGSVSIARLPTPSLANLPGFRSLAPITSVAIPTHHDTPTLGLTPLTTPLRTMVTSSTEYPSRRAVLGCLG